MSADQILDEVFVAQKTEMIDEAPSLYIEGTDVQYAWDSTSLGDFKRCPRFYQLHRKEGWTAKSESVDLRFGSEYHQALQEYDCSLANGVKHEDAIHDVIRELLIRTEDFRPDPDTRAGKYKSRRNLVQLTVDYLDFFGPNDPAKTAMLESGRPAVELSFRFELDWGPSAGNRPYILCGHIDRIVEFNDQLLATDRKTTTRTLGPYFFKQFEPNNQMTLYTLAGQIITGTPIKGVMIDAAQVLLEEPNRFVRGLTYRSPEQLEEWLNDLKITLKQAEACAEEGYWPMNDTACDKYGGCPFREVCSKSPSVRDMYLKSDFVQLPMEDRWNPLKPR